MPSNMCARAHSGAGQTDRTRRPDVLITEQAQPASTCTGSRETRPFLSPHRADGRSRSAARAARASSRARWKSSRISASSTASLRPVRLYPVQRDYLAEGRRVESLVAEGVVPTTCRALSHARDAAAVPHRARDARAARGARPSSGVRREAHRLHAGRTPRDCASRRRASRTKKPSACRYLIGCDGGRSLFGNALRKSTSPARRWVCEPSSPTWFWKASNAMPGIAFMPGRGG